MIFDAITQKIIKRWRMALFSREMCSTAHVTKSDATKAHKSAALTSISSCKKLLIQRLIHTNSKMLVRLTFFKNSQGTRNNYMTLAEIVFNQMHRTWQPKE
jgi:hypothetical protein